jgi:glycosyltransferase involved in cell wall biosynthesis
MPPVSVSIVIPVHNELENIPLLYEQLAAVLPELPGQHEILFVNDGSCDGSREKLDELAARDERVRVVHLRKKFGQSAAMLAGIQQASRDVVVTMDGDLQNDPADIPTLVRKLDEGFDLVHGWRHQRHDAWLHRKLPSFLANKLIAWITRFPIRDLGCTLKAIRREVAQELELYGEMHRFIPILAHARGARCAELRVRHHARRFGKTHYGLSRTIRVVLDLITVKYLIHFFASPLKLFGRFALASGALGGLCLLAAVGMQLAGGISLLANPLLVVGVLGLLGGLQLMGLGLLSEVASRIYFTTQPKQNYAIREVVQREEGADLGQRRAA